MRKIDGVPADEMFLAKIIQNAKAFDLKACKNREFLFSAKDSQNPSLSEFPTNNQIKLVREFAIGVCALGAAKLTGDTRRSVTTYREMPNGNDSSYKKLDPEIICDDSKGFTIGAAFQQAMNE